MAKTNFDTVHLRKDTAERLKRLRIASSYQTGIVSSYSEVIDSLIEGLRRYNPALHSIYSRTGGENTAEDIR